MTKVAKLPSWKGGIAERLEFDMKEPLYDYDPSAGLKGPEAIAIFLSDAFETGDAEYIAKALGIVARARGMKELAQETGLSRQQLYRSLSSHGNPTLKTLLAVTKALGVDITARLHPQPSGADTV